MKPQEFIDALSTPAQEVAAATGVPAGFTVAQAALESAWGSSRLSTEGCNLFGVKADASWTGPTLTMLTHEVVGGESVVVNAKWRKYSGWGECLEDHAEFLHHARYAAAFTHSDDSESFARAIAAAGYATDPDYATKIIQVIRAHGLSALDQRPSAQPPPPLQPDSSIPTPTGDAPVFPILAAVLPSLINAAPDLIRAFGNSTNPVVERNAQIAQKVGDAAVAAVGAVNLQDAAEKIQTDPAAAEKWRAAVQENLDSWVGMAVKLAELDEKSKAAAKDFVMQYDRSAVIGKFTFVEFLSLIFVLIAAVGAGYVLWGDFTSEIKGAVITLILIGGFTGVQTFWFGSSMGSMVKNPPKTPVEKG